MSCSFVRLFVCFSSCIGPKTGNGKGTGQKSQKVFHLHFLYDPCPVSFEVFQVNDIEICHAAAFLDCLSACNLTQHVTVATHRLGHTLDLIISRSNESGMFPLMTSASLIISLSHAISGSRGPLLSGSAFSGGISDSLTRPWLARTSEMQWMHCHQPAMLPPQSPITTTHWPPFWNTILKTSIAPVSSA